MLMASFAGGALVLLQPERFVAPGRAAAAEEGGEGEEEGRCADALASTAAPRSSVTAKIGGNDRDQLASSHHEATERVFKSEFSVFRQSNGALGLGSLRISVLGSPARRRLGG